MLTAIAWDIVGEPFLKRYAGKRRSMYRCRCECGRIRMVPAHKVEFSDPTPCRVCANRIRTGSNNSKWAGVGRISGAFWSRVLGNARKRGIAVRVTIAEAWKLYLQQGGRCALTNLPITFAPLTDKRGTASLDRISSKKGYVIGNVQWVHKDINIIKRELSQERFIELCGLVTAYRGRPCRN